MTKDEFVCISISVIESIFNELVLDMKQPSYHEKPGPLDEGG